MPDETSAAPLLRAIGVQKAFGGVRAVRGVDWSIDRGEICGIVGPNGSGKTTLFHLLSGYHSLTAGSIEWQGRDIGRLPARRRARLGLVRTFQQAEVFASLSVFDNVMVASRHALSTAATPDDADPASVIRLVGLDDVAERRAGSLSFGTRRLVGLAMAVAMQPALLLLDEPTSGLSDEESTEIRHRLFTLRDRGLTIAIIDHHMDFLLPLCDRVVLLRSGEKLWEGPPTEFAHDETVLAAYLGVRSTIS